MSALSGCNRVGHACQTILACRPYEQMYGKHRRPPSVTVAPARGATRAGSPTVG